jgi:hypothetical protein
MFSKLAMAILVAFTGLHVVAAGPVTSDAYTCPNGRYLYCCTFPPHLSSEDVHLIDDQVPTMFLVVTTPLIAPATTAKPVGAYNIHLTRWRKRYIILRIPHFDFLYFADIY